MSKLLHTIVIMVGVAAVVGALILIPPVESQVEVVLEEEVLVAPSTWADYTNTPIIDQPKPDWVLSQIEKLQRLDSEIKYVVTYGIKLIPNPDNEHYNAITYGTYHDFEGESIQHKFVIFTIEEYNQLNEQMKRRYHIQSPALDGQQLRQYTKPYDVSPNKDGSSAILVRVNDDVFAPRHYDTINMNDYTVLRISDLITLGLGDTVLSLYDDDPSELFTMAEVENVVNRYTPGEYNPVVNCATRPDVNSTEYFFECNPNTFRYVGTDY